MLSASLVVGDALGLGGAGLPGRKRQHHQGNDVRKHIVHHAGDVHVQQEVKAGVHIAQRPAEAEQHSRPSY